ncbi:MAG: hypothetical protein II919_03865 [Lachnospiraceae bacterium]|nr:hypothetical protein [Lachnospiraceae bacterium]
MATYVGWSGYSDVPTENRKDNVAVFSVIAYGREGKSGLHYQWYQNNRALTDIDESYSFRQGANTSVLKVGIESMACFETYEYYCVITDDAGHSVKTRTVKLDTKHRYIIYDRGATVKPEGHALYCVGEGCNLESEIMPHTYGDWQWVTDEAGNQLYKYQTCTVCGYKETMEVHEHDYDYAHMYTVSYEDLTIIKEDDKKGEYIYEFNYNGKTMQAGADRTGHFIDCSEPGYTFTHKEAHNWGPYRLINNATEDHHGTIYRIRKEWGMDETWIKTYYDWHTHPVNVTNGKAKTEIAAEGASVMVQPKPVEGKRVNGGTATISYQKTVQGNTSTQTKTIALTKLTDGKLYVFKVPTSGVNGYLTVGSRQYPIKEEYGAEFIDVEFTYTDCTNHTGILKNAVEATCTKDGYTGLQRRQDL